MQTKKYYNIDKFPPGMCGRVRLIGVPDTVFEFACGRDTVILNNCISSPKIIFEELVAEVVQVDVDPASEGVLVG